MRHFSWWKNRVVLVWTFVRFLDHGKSLEKELQMIEQRMYDLKLSTQMNPSDKEKELAFQLGYFEGIKWCMNRLKDGK